MPATLSHSRHPSSQVTTGGIGLYKQKTIDETMEARRDLP
jgi:hypothetical protein